jgi:hypothetical protein
LSARSKSIREKRIERIKKNRRSHEWPFASRYKSDEMTPIIDFINDSNSNSIIREILKKYLVIACVSLIEEVLSGLARRTIEEKKIDISLFGSEISKVFSKNPKGTIGEFVAGYHPWYGSAEKIDHLFSSIFKSDIRFANLNITFFEAVVKLDRYYHSREFKGLGTKYLYKNWRDFISIFEKRNKILHGMANVRLSNTRVFCFCDYTLNFLSATIAVCFMDEDILRELKRTDNVLTIL